MQSRSEAGHVNLIMRVNKAILASCGHCCPYHSAFRKTHHPLPSNLPRLLRKRRPSGQTGARAVLKKQLLPHIKVSLGRTRSQSYSVSTRPRMRTSIPCAQLPQMSRRGTGVTAAPSGLFLVMLASCCFSSSMLDCRRKAFKQSTHQVCLIWLHQSCYNHALFPFLRKPPAAVVPSSSCE